MEQMMKSTKGLDSEITERSFAEQQLKLFAKVFENALEGISITDANGNIVAVNQSFTKITGYRESDVLGKNPRVLKSQKHGPEFYKKMWHSLLVKGKWTGEIWNRRANGEVYPEILNINSICDANGNVSNYVAVFHDITDMKLNEELIKHRAYHDALTGLPNRFLAQDRLTMALNNAKRKQTQIAVFYMDLDNFKRVNDSLGHPVGDVLLQQVAERLLSLVREEDTVARLGGDEFLIIGGHISSEKEVIDLGNRLLRGFSSPFKIETQELSATLSIGGAIYPQDGIDADTLTKNADSALYQAKCQGKNKFFIFTHELSKKARIQLRLEEELRQALLNGELEVSYQPKVKPETGVLAGMEAIIGWQKPDGTLIGPEGFISLAEDMGLIGEIGNFVFEEICKTMQLLGDMGCSNQTKMSVRLSSGQFGQAHLLENILSILKENNAPVSQLELGVTETIMTNHQQDTATKFLLLAEAGVSIAIDDYGIGNSSLYSLKTLPVSTLNIDCSFIRNLTTDPDCCQIVETIVLVANNLGICVVAQGVETKEQVDLLKSFGCDVLAGSYYSPPLSFAGLVDFMKKS
jgi:diguanylate cyclase (GGDEF)-like protein/PAS domain S-box-containing protein